MSATWGFGIVRSGGLPSERARFEELCSLASKAAGIDLVPFFAANLDDLVGAIEDQTIGLGWVPPIPTIDLQSTGSIVVLAVPARDGAISYHSALIVRRGGPKTMAELRGLRAAWVEPFSAAGYVLPRIHLTNQGFQLTRFFAREIFVHSHRGVVDLITNGDADVGATYCTLDSKNERVVRSPWVDENGSSIRPIEVLATTGPIPNDALVASRELPAAARAALTRWLLAPDPRSAGLMRDLVGTMEFRVTPENHFASLRHSLRAARARGIAALPTESRMRVRVR